MKNHLKSAAALSFVAVALSGCIDHRDYESTPVKVATPKGTVVCQLYRQNQVIWDEAISVPKGMTIAEGDQVCINEGLRRLGKT